MSNIYLVITTNELQSALDSLIQQKTNRGYDTQVKCVEQIDDPLGPDIHEHIRKYVLAKNPRFLLLAGDYNKVPGYPFKYGNNTYLSDVYFGMKDTDKTPKIPVGRLSATNISELEKICNVILNYPNDNQLQWRRTVIFSGWIPWAGRQTDPDDSGWRCLEEIGSYFDVKFEYENKIESSEVAKSIWNAHHSTNSSLKQTIEEGALILRYIGHGTRDMWFNIGTSDAFSDDNFTDDDVQNLKLGRWREGTTYKTNWKIPLVISAACWTGDIDSPGNVDSLAEKWQKSCKAIGVFAADTESSSFWNARILPLIFHEIITNRRRIVGDVLINSMELLHKKFINDPRLDFDSFKMYRYLGDPDTEIAARRIRKKTLIDTSNNGPATTNKNNKLLINWIGVGNQYLNFVTSEDGITFSNKVTLTETASDSVAMTVFNQKFFTAYADNQNNIHIKESRDGQTWTNYLAPAEGSQSSPALTVCKVRINDQDVYFLYIAWRSLGDDKITLMRLREGGGWQDKLTLEDTTESGPALVEFKGNLLLSWRGKYNNILNIMPIASDLSQSFDKIMLPETTISKPCLHVHAGIVYLAWQGVGNQYLNLVQSHNGKEWGEKMTFDNRGTDGPEMCVGGPALGTIGNNLIWCWTGTNSQLNTMIQDWRIHNQY